MISFFNWIGDWFSCFLGPSIFLIYIHRDWVLQEGNGSFPSMFVAFEEYRDKPNHSRFQYHPILKCPLIIFISLSFIHSNQWEGMFPSAAPLLACHPKLSTIRGAFSYTSFHILDPRPVHWTSSSLSIRDLWKYFLMKASNTTLWNERSAPIRAWLPEIY